MRLTLVASILFLFAFSFFAYALDVELYREGAWVREELSVAPGTSEIKIEFPYSASFDSFRVVSQEVRIESISFSTLYLSDDEIPAIKDLKDKLKELEEEKDKLLVKKRSADLSFDIFRVVLNKIELRSPSDAQAWMSLIEDRTGRYLNDVRDIERKIREIDSQIDILRKKLKDVDTPDSRRKNVALLKLGDSSKGGKVIYSYFSPQAGWVPSYKLTFSPKDRRVDIEVYANLWQRTGKDWKDANIVLASIRKGASLLPPEERDLVVDIVKKESVLKPVKEKALPMMLASPVHDRDARFREVEAGVKIDLKRGAFVPSTGENQKLLIWRGSLNAEDVFYLCRSYQEPSAYRMVKVKLSSPFDFLPGDAEFFFGEAFIGKGDLKAMSREGYYDICFGSDERVEVERKAIKLGEREKGVLDKSSVREYGYEVKVKNLAKEEIKLVLDEVFPVSLDSRIKVELVKVEPKESERTETGHLKWELKLKPGEERDVSFSYKIVYPQGEDIELEWR